MDHGYKKRVGKRSPSTNKILNIINLTNKGIQFIQPPLRKKKNLTLIEHKTVRFPIRTSVWVRLPEGSHAFLLPNSSLFFYFLPVFNLSIKEQQCPPNGG